jgi:hypothetical protein
MKRTIIVTHRPVLKESWKEDFNKIFFNYGYWLYGNKNKHNFSKISDLENAINENIGSKYVYFVSMQDLRGSSLAGGQFDKNSEIFDVKWDLVIIDEAHEGTQTALGWNVMDLFIKNNKKAKALYLSGTPFNLLNAYSDLKFSEDEIFSWDYVSEQKAKKNWTGPNNPYAEMPKLEIHTFDLGNLAVKFKDGVDLAFNFKEFFRIWTGDKARDICYSPIVNQNHVIGEFVYKEDIISFLNLLTDFETGKVSNYPFSSKEKRDEFRHTLWMLPGVKEAKALEALLNEHPVFAAYTIVNVAGDRVGSDALRSEEHPSELQSPS